MRDDNSSREEAGTQETVDVWRHDNYIHNYRLAKLRLYYVDYQNYKSIILLESYES